MKLNFDDYQNNRRLAHELRQIGKDNAPYDDPDARYLQPSELTRREMRLAESFVSRGTPIGLWTDQPRVRIAPRINDNLKRIDRTRRLQDCLRAIGRFVGLLLIYGGSGVAAVLLVWLGWMIVHGGAR